MRRIVRASALAAGLVGLTCGPAAAQQPAMENLKQAPGDRQVLSVRYCRGRYVLGFADGSGRDFAERDLRFATDSSPLGPLAARPVLVPTGRVGDRALIIFAEPREIRTLIRDGC